MTREEKDHLLDTLDRLGCALAEHDHQWTDEERTAYENAVRILARELKVGL